MSPVILGLLLILVFVCGLLTGSIITSATKSTVTAPQKQQTAPQQSAQKPAGPSPAELQHIRELEEILAKEPSNREKLVELGNINFDTGRYHQSIEAYERALAINPNDAAVLTDCGVMYRAIGQFDKALELFLRAQQVHPGHPIALFNQGVVLNYDLHRHEDALKVWRELARLHPGSATPGGRTIEELIKQVEEDLKK